MTQKPPGVIVYAELFWHGHTPAGKPVVQTYHRHFLFVRQSGAWRLRDDDFFEAILPASLRGA